MFQLNRENMNRKTKVPEKKTISCIPKKSPKVTQTPDLWLQRQARYSRPSSNEGRGSYCSKITQVEKTDKKVVYGKKI